MENYKTLGQLLQQIVEEENSRFSLHEFLLEASKEDLKRIQYKLVDADRKQFFEYMDGFNFVSKYEVEMACNDYLEHVQQRPLSMGEMVDLGEVAEDYIQERNLHFEEPLLLPF